jgi:catechol 2,3-dioxygenase-like lactoylglutathione lyase family enzyme
MIKGAHVLLYSENPEADRAFFRDVLGFPHVNVGGGWLIFKLPPSELAFHPTDGIPRKLTHGGRGLLGGVLYLMCDDLRALVASLKSKKVKCTPIGRESWGIRTSIRLPSGSEIGLYQPTHPTAFDLGSSRVRAKHRRSRSRDS